MLLSEDNSKKKILISALVVLIVSLFAVGVYFYMEKNSVKQTNSTNQYKAVFLTNGQVYFGKINKKTDKWINMEDIYYLQLDHSIQDQKNDKDLSESDVTLAKLGNEIHGPKDKMEVNRDHVLFVENLSEDSKVLSAIDEHKNNQVVKQ